MRQPAAGTTRRLPQSPTAGEDVAMTHRLAGSLVLLGLLTAMPVAADPLADRMATVTAGFQGTVFLHAKNLATGKEFALDADVRVRTASTIKLPILCALQALVAGGRVGWDERLVMTAEDKVSGSGVLASLTDDTALTLRNLAVLMIIVSDNTATNLLIDRITADAVNDYLDTIGLTRTRLNRKILGRSGPSGWSRAGLLEENTRFGLGVATPREMVRLLELLHKGRIVSREASQDVMDILARQQVRTGIARHAPQAWKVASKSGSLDALRSDVGIAYTDGGPIALAITVDDMPETDYSPDNAGEQLIWELTRALVEGLSGR
jgi:beta-lactamase class A